MSQMRPNLIAGLLLVIGLGIVISVSTTSPEPSGNHENSGEDIAKIEAWQGKVRLQSPGEKSWRDVEALITLKDKDRVLVLSGSLATLTTTSGYEIRLTEKTQVVLEYWDPNDKGSPIFMHFAYGNFELLKAGMQRQLWIVREGQVYIPSLAPKERSQALVIDVSTPIAPAPMPEPPSEPEPAPQPEVATPDAPAQEEVVATEPQPQVDPTQLPAKLTPPSENQDPTDTTMLTDQEIDKSLAARAAQFRRCQAQALKAGQKAKGTLNIFFSISNNGKVEKARLISNATDNETLGRCVLNIFERLKFREYTGAVIETAKPINFR